MQLTPHPVTLRQLQYVVAVADRRSFRQAAEDCHVSQPSLSAQIAQVEAALDVKLFDRDRRRVVLTPAGEAVAQRARALLVAADELVVSARQLSDPFAGTLRIGVIPTIGPYLLPEFAPTLREQFPKLTFIWAEEKTAVLVDRLNRAELDAAIVAREAELGNLAHCVLGKDPFVFAAPPNHPLGGVQRPLKPQDLEGEKVLLLDDGHCFRDQTLSFCARAGLEEVGYRATSLATLVQMTAGGAGITILPSIAVDLENRRQSLWLRPFAPKVPFRTLALVWRKGASMERAIRAVGKSLRERYEALSASFSA